MRSRWAECCGAKFLSYKECLIIFGILLSILGPLFYAFQHADSIKNENMKVVYEYVQQIELSKYENILKSNFLRDAVGDNYAIGKTYAELSTTSNLLLYAIYISKKRLPTNIERLIYENCVRNGYNDFTYDYATTRIWYIYKDEILLK